MKIDLFLKPRSWFKKPSIKIIVEITEFKDLDKVAMAIRNVQRDTYLAKTFSESLKPCIPQSCLTKYKIINKYYKK